MKEKKYIYKIKLTDMPRTCKECRSYDKIARKCRLPECKYEDKR